MSWLHVSHSWKFVALIHSVTLICGWLQVSQLQLIRGGHAHIVTSSRVCWCTIVCLVICFIAAVFFQAFVTYSQVLYGHGRVIPQLVSVETFLCTILVCVSNNRWLATSNSLGVVYLHSWNPHLSDGYILTCWVMAAVNVNSAQYVWSYLMPLAVSMKGAILAVCTVSSVIYIYIYWWCEWKSHVWTSFIWFSCPCEWFSCSLSCKCVFWVKWA